MEVGAVKQAFNNEVILLKKKLNQAKIQIIHKLTRKAKQLTEKKASEQLKEKLKRKAESAVKEVLIIKKIKAKDIAKFIVTHLGELNTFLNRPQVDQDKACARLLLHKALQDKYKFIRDRFSNVPIQDLFMSRLERRKMKKEAKEKQKNKKKGKDSTVVNSEGDWSVEDVVMGDNSEVGDDNSDGDEISGEEGSDNDMSSDENDNDDGTAENDESNEDGEEHNDSGGSNDEQEQNDSELSDNEIKQQVKHIKPNVKSKLVTDNVKTKEETKTIVAKEMDKDFKLNPRKEIVKKNPEKKQKDTNKHKNLNEKILQRKFKKDSDAPVVENKIVDPFFITATGENYMSVVEPRAPDEVKEVHKQGNRKLRRAVMFGHVPKSRLRQNDNYNNDNRFNKQNGFDRGNNFRDKFNEKLQFKDRQNFNDNKKSFNDRKGFNNDFNGKRGFNNKGSEDKPEKLHPSWEAKKKKSGILPFEGKKIVFDES